MFRSRSRKLSTAVLGASLAALALTAMSALGGAGAGTASGSSVKAKPKLTSLAGSSKKAILSVRNKGTGPAISMQVKAGNAPFTVNSNARVANLNADLLDGLSGDDLQKRVTGTCATGSAVRVIGAGGGVTCQPFWALTGNGGTGATNFLGTADAQPLIVKTNNAEAMRVTAAGSVGVGTATPGAPFEADGSTTAVRGRLGTAACTGFKVAVEGCASTDFGLVGYSPGGIGIGAYSGTSTALTASSTSGVGIDAGSTSNTGIKGSSGTGNAIFGQSTGGGIGVLGDSTARGLVGTLGGTSCAGVYAVGGCTGATTAYAVWGRNATGSALVGSTDSGNVFLGVVTGAETHVARIDSTGKGFFNGGTQNSGADYAESVKAVGANELEPGDVLAIDNRHGFGVAKATTPYSTRVAGVYSTKPAILAVGNHGVDDSLAGNVPVAMLGIVPTKVTAKNGAIHAGDLLTTSSTPGYAMLAKPVVIRGVKIYPTGAILGKALEPLRGSRGMVKVLVTLR